MANFCPRCGGATAPTDAFCGACGTPLTGGEYDCDGSANPYDAGAPVADGAAYYADGETNVGPSFWGAFGYCLKNYFNFRGRATRTEFWGWLIVDRLIAWASASVAGYVGLWLWLAASIVPTLAVFARRLHDVGCSSIWIFAAFLWFVVGAAVSLGLSVDALNRSMLETLDWIVEGPPALLWLVALLAPGTNGANRFGAKRLNPANVRR